MAVQMKPGMPLILPAFSPGSTGKIPATIQDANFSPLRLLTLQSRLSAAYKGLMALLMKKGGCDFVNGDPVDIQTYFDQAIDIHHIFPKAYCENRNTAGNSGTRLLTKPLFPAGQTGLSGV